MYFGRVDICAYIPTENEKNQLGGGISSSRDLVKWVAAANDEHTNKRYGFRHVLSLLAIRVAHGKSERAGVLTHTHFVC